MANVVFLFCWIQCVLQISHDWVYPGLGPMVYRCNNAAQYMGLILGMRSYVMCVDEDGNAGYIQSKKLDRQPLL